MPSIPSPSVMKLDPNDENIILGIPEDYDPEEKRNEASSTPKKVPGMKLVSFHFLKLIATDSFGL